MAYEREEWRPVTGLGKLVASGEIKSIDQVLESGRPIKEPQIVDMFLPDLEDRAVVIVGNRNGYIGFGQGKDVQVGNAIKKAIVKAKMNIIKVRRGCGSWECGCDITHSIPMQVEGTAGSVRVTLKPAPQGIGLVTGDISKKVLELAGIKDVWTFARGQTRTTINFAKATFNALNETNMIRTGRSL
jgi:small subunit ribosomal protein S5